MFKKSAAYGPPSNEDSIQGQGLASGKHDHEGRKSSQTSAIMGGSCSYNNSTENE